ncbi:MAG: hypothetical protein ACFFGZ_03275 [Candidatus Thorarchaeota archaeon]
MNDAIESSAGELDYNKMIVLYFLSKTDRKVNQTQIKEITKMAISTLRQKLDLLQKEGLIFIVRKGIDKQIYLTGKGREEIAKWVETSAGNVLTTEFDKVLGFR